ncbi:MAG: hypothetical protein KDC98_03130, partial [Planctomycetes bacterium]|nr:hypothetical protein [Planctomycetota bacterium]
AAGLGIERDPIGTGHRRLFDLVGDAGEVLVIERGVPRPLPLRIQRFTEQNRTEQNRTEQNRTEQNS